MNGAIWVLVACVVAVCAMGMSWWTWRNAPGARLWNELRTRIEDLEHDSEQLHARLNKRARQENLDAARAGKAAKHDVLAEAQSVLALGASAAAPASPPDPATERNAFRAQVLKAIH